MDRKVLVQGSEQWARACPFSRNNVPPKPYSNQEGDCLSGLSYVRYCGVDMPSPKKSTLRWIDRWKPRMCRGPGQGCERYKICEKIYLASKIWAYC